MRKRRPVRAVLPHFLVVLKKIPVPGQALPEKVSGQMWRAYPRATASATRMPSTAALTIPPA